MVSQILMLEQKCWEGGAIHLLHHPSLHENMISRYKETNKYLKSVCQSYKHTQTSMHAHTHTYTHKHTHTNIYGCTHTYTHEHTHRPHTHLHTRTRTLTHSTRFKPTEEVIKALILKLVKKRILLSFFEQILLDIS